MRIRLDAKPPCSASLTGTVSPAATREDKRLTHGADGDGNDDLIGKLGQLSAAAWPDMGRLAKRSKHRLHRGKSFRVTSGHDGQLASSRASRASRNRSVEIVYSLFGVPLGMVDRFIRAYRSHVDSGGSV